MSINYVLCPLPSSPHDPFLNPIKQDLQEGQPGPNHEIGNNARSISVYNGDERRVSGPVERGMPVTPLWYFVPSGGRIGHRDKAMRSAGLGDEMINQAINSLS